MLDARSLIGLLAEPARLRLVSTMVLDGPGTIEHLATRAGVELRDAVDGVDRLVGSGLVELIGHEFHLLEAAFKMAARAEAPSPELSQHGGEPESSRRVLDQCLRDGRLVHMPTKQSRKRVLLEHIAHRFEPGVHYSERQVNSSLRRLSDDTATLRRYLVDFGFLDRSDGEYWRSGGEVR